MNDVRETIERVGARFDPPDGGFDDLSRRRTRARVRRRLTTGALALTVAAGGSLLAVLAFPASTPRAPSKVKVLATWAASAATPSAAASSGTTCPTPSGDDPPPVVLSSTSGAAGSSIEVTGMFGTEELWMQLWWNAGELAEDIAPPLWPPTGPDLHFAPAGPGPVVNLASTAGPAAGGDCSFQTQFTVPDVEPGTYEMQWVYGAEAHGPKVREEGAFALLTSVLTFQVTG